MNTRHNPSSGASRHSELEHLTAPTPKRRLALWPFLAVGVLAAGLTTLAIKTTPHTPVTLIVGIDASDSVRVQGDNGSLLGENRAAIADMAGQLVAGLDHLKLVRVDRQAREFFDGEAPSGNETLLSLLMENTNRPASQNGTLPAKFWTLAAQQAASKEFSPGAGVAIVYAGDADNDDLTPQSSQQIACAAQQLADNPRVVSVEFLGFNPKNSAELRTLFAPLGARLRLQSADAPNPRSIIDRLNAARDAPISPETTSQGQ